jgi:hypothetical protein
VDPDGLTITWRPNIETDLGYYAVCRGTSEDFVPSQENRIGTPQDTVYFDNDWRWDQTYYYKVAAVDIHGNPSDYSLLAPDVVIGIETSPRSLATYLGQNYPNPFNPSTRIAFGLNKDDHVSLRIYDVKGRLVRVVVDEQRKANRYERTWDGRDQSGRLLASGIYFYKLTTSDFSETKKMVLVR